MGAKMLCRSARRLWVCSGTAVAVKHLKLPPSRAWRSEVLAGITLASGALALMLAVNPQNAVADCAVTSSSNNNTVTCGTTTTVDQTFPTPPTGRDRAYVFPSDDLPRGNVTGNVTPGATVDGFGLAIANISRGAADINFTNAGTITLTAGVPTVGGTAALSLLSFGGNITYSGNGNVNSGGFNATAIDLATSGAGNIVITTAGTVNANQALNATATSGSIALTNFGVITGSILMTTGGVGSTFVNNGTWNASGSNSFAAGNPQVFNNGTMNLSGGTTINFAGASTFGNNGLLNVLGPTTFNGNLTFFNNATGTISLSNGTAMNQLSLPGNYVGSPGSQLVVGVDPLNGRADQLHIAGTASGTTSVIADYLSNRFVTSPIPVVTTGSPSTATFSLANPRPFNGLLIFGINQTSPGDFTLNSTLSPTAVVSAIAARAAVDATQVTISGINTELRQRRDRIQLCAIVGSAYCQSAASAPGNRLAYSADDSAAGDQKFALGYQDENKTSPGLLMAVKAPPPPQPVVEAGPKPAVWVQAFDDWQKLNQSVVGQNDGTKQNTYGFQGGFDETWRNLFASGDALVLGLVGGDTQVSVHFDNGTARANLSGPGFGGYWTYINGGFSMDGIVKNDWFHLTDNDLINGSSSSASVQNFSVTGNAQYKFAVLTNSFIEPTAGFGYTQTTFSDVPVTLDLVNGHTTRVQGGARFGTAWDYNGIHFEPTLLGLAYSDVQITGTPLQTIGVVVPTDEGKVRGEFDLTFNMDFGSGFSGFAEGDVRFGDNLVGAAMKGGLRKQW